MSNIGEIHGSVTTAQFTAETAKYSLLKWASGKLVVSIASDTLRFIVGSAEDKVLAADDYGAVRLRNAPGVRKCIAVGAIALGVEVYSAAAGKVGATGTNKIGLSMSAAGADLDEVLIQLD